MNRHTALTALIPSPLPLLEAPMAGAQGSALALAVCAAGGVGSLPAAMLNAAQLQNELSAFQMAIASSAPASAVWGDQLPVNVNFFCHTPPVPQADKEAAWRAKLAAAYQSHGIDPQSVGAGPLLLVDFTVVVRESRPSIIGQ